MQLPAKAKASKPRSSLTKVKVQLIVGYAQVESSGWKSDEIGESDPNHRRYLGN